MGTQRWRELAPRIYRFEDSCAVYAVEGDHGGFVVNAGMGRWLDALDELPFRPDTVLLTHFFRDHSHGALRCAREGMQVAAPWTEREQLADAQGLFSRRETYIIYDNIWDLYAPTTNIPVSRWLHDHEDLRLAGLPISVVPTPGASFGAVSYLVDVAGTRTLFCGELIHSPGRIARVAPLQYNYNDLPGALQLLDSVGVARETGASLLAPSLAPDVIPDADAALEALADSLRFSLQGRPEVASVISRIGTDDLIPITEHLVQSRDSEASTYFLISTSGKVLSIDYGYRGAMSFSGAYPYPRHRRPRLHGISALKRERGIDRIDVVLLTHYHDDHVNGVPLLQRLYGTECWAGENFAHLVADPAAYNFPCMWPEPIAVHAKPLGTEFTWEEYSFRLFPMSGHTRWSTLVVFEVDGEKVVASGDQYFFWSADAGVSDMAEHNHVYRNGAVLSSFRDSNQIMEQEKPDIVLPGHGLAYRWTERHRELIRRYADAYEDLHRRLMPLDDEDVHFDVDSRALWLSPYRTRMDAAAPIDYVAVVRNPYPHRETLTLRPIVPPGWEGEAVSVVAEARAEVRAELRVTPPMGTLCRRRPVSVELSSPTRSFGPVAEALITIGEARF